MYTTYDLLIKKLINQASIKKTPINGAFELTARCNFNCKMCYIHNQKDDCNRASKELTAEQWIKLGSDARDAGLLTLTLTGGEIFLRHDFTIIYEELSRMGFNISLYSNASLIDSKIAKWLGSLPPSQMEITIYGASPETYYRVCGNAEAYSKVMRAIDLLIAEGINIVLRTTVTNYNIRDYEALAESSYKRGIPLYIVDYIYPITSAADNYRLTPEELVDYKINVATINKKVSGIYLKDDSLPQFSDCRSQLINELSNAKHDLQRELSAFTCSAGSSSFWITWDGRMIPCTLMEDPVTAPLEVGFSKAWEELYRQCSTIPTCTDCSDCNVRDYCITCPAKLKCETGFYDHPADYLCKMARLSKEKYEKENFI